MNIDINTNLADNELIIASTVQTIVLKTPIDLAYWGLFSGDGFLSDMIDCAVYNKMMNALKIKDTVLIIITGQFRLDYNGKLCTRLLDYKII